MTVLRTHNLIIRLPDGRTNNQVEVGNPQLITLMPDSCVNTCTSTAKRSLLRAPLVETTCVRLLIVWSFSYRICCRIWLNWKRYASSGWISTSASLSLFTTTNASSSLPCSSSHRGEYGRNEIPARRTRAGIHSDVMSLRNDLKFWWHQGTRKFLSMAYIDSVVRE